MKGHTYKRTREIIKTTVKEQTPFFLKKKKKLQSKIINMFF